MSQIRNKVRGYNEHGDNQLNPNVVSIPKEKCQDCQAIFVALADMKEIDKDNIEPALLDELHCNNGHRISKEEIVRVLNNEQ